MGEFYNSLETVYDISNQLYVFLVSFIMDVTAEISGKLSWFPNPTDTFWSILGIVILILILLDDARLLLVHLSLKRGIQRTWIDALYFPLYFIFIAIGSPLILSTGLHALFNIARRGFP